MSSVAPKSMLAWLRAQPAFTSPRRRPAESARHVSSGFARLDHLIGGGFRRGDLTELTGPSGRTALALAALGAATRRGEAVGWIDPHDALDPLSVQGAGVCLDHFLWVRPPGVPRDAGQRRRSPLRQALKAVDLILDAGGFTSLVLDLESLVARERALANRPAWWVRLSRRVETADAALLVLGEIASYGAGLRLHCERQGTLSLVSELQVRVLRRRGGAPRGRVTLTLTRPVD